MNVNYFEILEKCKKKNKIMFVSPLVPDYMRDGEPDDEGWLKWKPVPSTTTEQDINELEKVIGLIFPSAYRNLLLSCHFLDLDFCDFILKGNPVNDKQVLKQFMLNTELSSRLFEKHFIPIGVGSDGHSYLVLNESGAVLEAYENNENNLQQELLSNDFSGWLIEKCN